MSTHPDDPVPSVVAQSPTPPPIGWIRLPSPEKAPSTWVLHNHRVQVVLFDLLDVLPGETPFPDRGIRHVFRAILSAPTMTSDGEKGIGTPVSIPITCTEILNLAVLLDPNREQFPEVLLSRGVDAHGVPTVLVDLCESAVLAEDVESFVARRVAEHRAATMERAARITVEGAASSGVSADALKQPVAPPVTPVTPTPVASSIEPAPSPSPSAEIKNASTIAPSVDVKSPEPAFSST